MTPKEKAKELADPNNWWMCTQKQAKRYALKVCDELIQACAYIDSSIRDNVEQLNASDNQFVSYWEDVKKEIEKL